MLYAGLPLVLRFVLVWSGHSGGLESWPCFLALLSCVYLVFIVLLDMLKYVNHDIVFQEFPDEVSLCINLSLCPHRCVGCHSSFLQTDLGEVLTAERLCGLIEAHAGITCVGFMGGDNDPSAVVALAKVVKARYGHALRVGWYSGSDRIARSLDLSAIDYIKVGGYRPQFGPLNAPTTNQRLYHRQADGTLTDLTHRFQADGQPLPPLNPYEVPPMLRRAVATVIVN